MKRLETERLILREYKLEDSHQVFNNWATNPNVSRYVTWNPHKDELETLEYLKSCIDEVNNGGYHWTVELKDNNELIGDIAVVNMSPDNSNCEVGYCYSEKHWGKGYATEALRKVIEYLINEEKFHLVTAKHQVKNPASGKVMMKAGMKYDATLRERILDKDTKEFDDLAVYSIIKEEL